MKIWEFKRETQKIEIYLEDDCKEKAGSIDGHIQASQYIYGYGKEDVIDNMIHNLNMIELDIQSAKAELLKLKGQQMNSVQMKAAAMHWLRFRKQLNYVATECGFWSADVIGCDSEHLIEIEVKVSRADLMAEFRNKLEKHEYYPDPLLAAERHNNKVMEELRNKFPGLPDDHHVIQQQFKWKKKNIKDVANTWYPTHMYFLVTKDLAQEALEIVEKKCPKYGIMYFSPHRFSDFASEHQIHVIRNAKRLRAKGVSEAVRDRLASRMASELIGLRDQLLRK